MYPHALFNAPGINDLFTSLRKGCVLFALSFLFFYSSDCLCQTPLPDPLVAGWNGEPVCEVLLENDSIRTLKCSFPPGVGHERHYHKAHFGYALSGSRFRITDSKGIREVDVPTGSNIYNKGIEWHEVLNIGDSTAVFLIIEPK